MKITKIDQQVKNQGRFSIFVDDKYSFSLSERQLADSGLKIGQEMSGSDQDKWKSESDFGKLWERALNWMMIRPRSQWEVDSYLNRITKNEDHKPKIVAKLQKLDLINDQKFATSWVESRRLLKTTSRQRLFQELLVKRVDKDIIEEVLDLDVTDDVQEIKKLIAKKKDKYPERQKLLAYLARQGFSYDHIKQAFDELE